LPQNVISHPVRYGVTFGYDALGRLVKDGSQKTGDKRFEYDLAGRRTRFGWSDGFFVSYEYLTTGEMKAIKESGTTVLATFGYDDLGRRTSLTRGNGTVTNYGYDPASRLAQLTDDVAGGSHDRTATFAYNPASEIGSRSHSNDAYAWKPGGNLDRWEVPNGLNQLVGMGGIGLAYDRRGNMVSDGARTLTYSSENLLTGAPGATLGMQGPASG